MDLQKISEIVEDTSDFSGVIQIVEKDKTVLHMARGYARYDCKIQNKIDTKFGIASGTKGFTALCILKLIEAGKLSLDDKVFSLLALEFPNMKKDVTVRHLLSNTSGIYDFFDEDIIEDFDEIFKIVPLTDMLGPSDLYPLLIDGEAYFEPGERFKYCNAGFVILGMLIEEISGMSYAECLNETILGPLGLINTACYKTNQLPENTAHGYSKDENGSWYSNIFEIPIACTADGGLYTSADDICNMWSGIMKGGFLRTDIKEEAFKDQADIHWGNSENLHYGLGFYIQKNQDGTVKNYFLVGGDPGLDFTTNYYVDTDRIVTLLGNTSDGVWALLDAISPYLD